MNLNRLQRRAYYRTFLTAFAFIANIPQRIRTEEQDGDASKSPININIPDGSKLCLHSNSEAVIQCHGVCDDELSPPNGSVSSCLMSMNHDDKRIQADVRRAIDCWHWNVTVPATDPNVPPSILQLAGCNFGISDVQMTDAGKYTCKLTGGSSVDRRSVLITVSESFAGKNETITVERGKPLEISCCLMANSCSDESFDVSSSLLCRNYTKQLTDLRDDGTYICVSNSTGTAHQRHTVIVQDPAEVTCFSNNDGDENCDQRQLWIPQGQDVIFQCRARGFPVPRLTISCTGGQSNDTIAKRTFLLIKNISNQDVGSCSCLANNQVGGKGTSSATLFLSVFRSAKIDRFYVKSESSDEDFQLLVCETLGEPVPAVVLYDLYMTILNESNGMVTFQLGSSSSMSSYSCVANNGQRNDSMTITVSSTEAEIHHWPVTVSLALASPVIIFSIGIIIIMLSSLREVPSSPSPPPPSPPWASSLQSLSGAARPAPSQPRETEERATRARFVTGEEKSVLSFPPQAHVTPSQTMEDDTNKQIEIVSDIIGSNWRDVFRVIEPPFQDGERTLVEVSEKAKNSSHTGSHWADYCLRKWISENRDLKPKPSFLHAIHEALLVDEQTDLVEKLHESSSVLRPKQESKLMIQPPGTEEQCLRTPNRSYGSTSFVSDMDSPPHI